MQGKVYLCKYCGEAFDSMPKLAAHISHYHSKRRKKPREERIIELLEELLDEIRGLRSDLKNLKIVEYTRKTEETVTEIRPEKPVNKNLPSFLQDNPWVDILSKRTD